MVEFDWQMGGDCTRTADHAQRDFGEGFNTDGQQLNDDEDEALQQKSESAPDASASHRPAAPVLRVMVNQEWVPLQVMLAVRACQWPLPAGCSLPIMIAFTAVHHC